MSRPRIERLINLLAYLLDSRRPVTFDELSRSVYAYEEKRGEALRRKFERDKDELREMGVNIAVVADTADGETGYTIDDHDYYLPHIELLPAERVAIEMISRLFLGSGTPFSGPAHSVVLKLDFDEGPIDLETRVPWLSVQSSPGESRLLRDVMDGLSRRKTVRFTYRTWEDEEPVERHVDPYGLYSRHGAWYVVGHCHLREQIRSFKLARIVSEVEVNPASPHTPDFEVPGDFDVSRESEWPFAPRYSAQAVVRFKPRLAAELAVEGLRIVDCCREGDGSVVVTYRVGDPGAFLGWVLEFGPDAVVLEPDWLVEKITKKLDGIVGVLEESDD